MSVAVNPLAYEPGDVSPPGATLAEWLERRGMSQVEFSRRAGLTPKHINQVLAGSAGLTPDVALSFENVTGIPARYWTQLESNHRAFRRRVEHEKELASSVELLDAFPIRELIKRGVLRAATSRAAQLRELLRFFGVGSVAALKNVWLRRDALRKSQVFESHQGALAAWLRIAERQAEAMSTAPFDLQRCRALPRQLRALTGLPFPVAIKRLRQLCAEAGIAVVTVRELPGCRINGAARWIAPGKAMIALSLRHRRNDIFWFTFFHELGHLLKHSKKETFIDLPDGDLDEMEEEADLYASRAVIPAQFEAELPGLRTESQIKDLARRVGVAPGIVLGRLQHEGWVPHRSQHNRLFVPYKYPDEA